LNSLIDKIYQKEIQGVFVVDWSRLSRNEQDGFLIKEIFKKDGIRLFEPNQEIILKDDSTNLLYGIKILLSSYERKRISVNVKRNLETSVKNGKVGGGLLINYGFTKDENKMLVIDPIESKVVKLIYQLSLEGKGTKVISNYLNENNIPTKRMNVKNSSMMVKGEKKSTFIWRDSVVYNILTNPIYKGERQFSGKTYNSPQIIDKDVFNVVQDILSNRKHFKDTTNKYFYLLKGLIRCLKCESRFYGRKREDLSDNQYICSSQRYKDTYCGTRGINIDKLDDYVWGSVLSLPNDIRKHIESDTNPIYEGQLKRLKNWEDNVRKLHVKKEKLLNLYLEKDKGFELIKSHMDKIQSELEESNHIVRLIRKEIVFLEEKNEVVESILNILKLEKEEIYDNERKRRILQTLIKFISIDWIKKLNTHFIWIEFKIDNNTELMMGKKIKISYKKSGWSLRDNGTETEFLFRKMTHDLTKFPNVKNSDPYFGMRLNDKEFKEKHPFKD
jgi:DNA invertase Pin-like site-specific DNA recombinase